MIYFGVVIGNEARYRRVAQPALQRVTSQSAILEERDARSIALGYNAIRERALKLDDLEALVLLHEDVAIRAPDFPERVRRAASMQGVAVFGTIGARGVRSLRWWDGDIAGRLEEPRGTLDYGEGPEDVDAVDGLILGVTRAGLFDVRFDESLNGFHGYDMDLCFQARALGYRVLALDLGIRHETKGGYGNRLSWIRANRAWRRKWRRDADARERLSNAFQDIKLLARAPELAPFVTD